MKKIKKNKKAVFSLIMAAVLLMAASYSYLWYTDSKKNTFIAGDVNIELWEAFDNDRDGNVVGLSYNSDGTIKTTSEEDEVYGPDEQYISSFDIAQASSVQKQPFLVNTGNTSEYTYIWVGIPQLNSAMYFLNDEDVELFDIYHYKRDDTGNIVYDDDGNPTLIEGVNDGWVLLEDTVPANCMDLGGSFWYPYAGSGVDIASGNTNSYFGHSSYNYEEAADIHYYLYAYTEPLEPGEETPTIFDEVKVIDYLTDDMLYFVGGFSSLEGGFIRNAETTAEEATAKGYTGNTSILDSDVLVCKDVTWGDIIRPITLNSYAIQSRIEELDETSATPLYEQAWNIYAAQDPGSYPEDCEVIVRIDNDTLYLSDGAVFEMPDLPSGTTTWSYYTVDGSVSKDGEELTNYGYLEPGDLITLKQVEKDGKKYVTCYYFSSTDYADSDEVVLKVTGLDGVCEVKHLTGTDTYLLPDTGSEEYTTWSLVDVTTGPMQHSLADVNKGTMYEDDKYKAKLLYSYDFLPLAEGTSIYQGMAATYKNKLNNKYTTPISYGHVYELTVCQDEEEIVVNQPVYKFTSITGTSYYTDTIRPTVGSTFVVPNLPDTSTYPYYNCWIRMIYETTAAEATYGYMDADGNTVTKDQAQIVHPGDVITAPDNNITYYFRQYHED